ncbi:diketogulonate reductase-like aldo/keto reductase [Frondihabitans sp. PhB188]|uniref:aldo/keto reductase n=1 Tax=Frondihabitans sp. PhB188 TaxID=2485200 RepID=UPI000F4A8047|nr:aldo/keto reductase [Frondihabitans sp. PhB188]ROQ40665.1 diketogulonate reductase-like aldo/keto reductase [Frondihabitans sp. PhB188]
MSIADLTVPLPNAPGVAMPAIGFGTWQVNREAVAVAAAAGYPAFDSATMYHTERDVAAGLADEGLAPADRFLTTKIWRTDMSDGGVRRAFHASSKNFGVDVVDLLLIHWPQNAKTNLETWLAMQELLDAGQVRAIGVSNFDAADLDALAKGSDVVPAVNQIELHPRRQRAQLVEENRQRGISTTAYSPLGQGGPVLRDPALGAIASDHGVTSAQVALRWLVQKGIVAIPRSSNPERIRENIDLDGFALDDDEMARIDDLPRQLRN